jgi:hypothetical protein
MGLSNMVQKPRIFRSLKAVPARNLLNDFKLEHVLPVFVPRGLQVFTMVRAVSKQTSMLPKPGSRIYGAPYIKFPIYNVPDFINHVFSHRPASATCLNTDNGIWHVVSTKKKTPAEAGAC